MTTNTSSITALKNQAMQLSVADRIRLAEEIWLSIPEEQAYLPISEARAQELERRVAEYDADPNSGQSWQDVKDELLGGR